MLKLQHNRHYLISIIFFSYYYFVKITTNIYIYIHTYDILHYHFY
ncbi:hypothetical protein CBY_1335 [Clostridium butyricum 5521]|uniref:Uncharacterized protein n=1 Tax=Clostridium butyricum E4 str. BoNT E BL5262 TaxID=632245 RepID=C4IIK0_CLOBU|nr:hypothetical protein CBY_1335 [Clostridium butyricum 5521]EEP54198.1 hypothetical protein CLP_2236 [Clostridium butyricum E4 str. BoNT E BL5262]